MCLFGYLVKKEPNLLSIINYLYICSTFCLLLIDTTELFMECECVWCRRIVHLEHSEHTHTPSMTTTASKRFIPNCRNFFSIQIRYDTLKSFIACASFQYTLFSISEPKTRTRIKTKIVIIIIASDHRDELECRVIRRKKKSLILSMCYYKVMKCSV